MESEKKKKVAFVSISLIVFIAVIVISFMAYNNVRNQRPPKSKTDVSTVPPENIIHQMELVEKTGLIVKSEIENHSVYVVPAMWSKLTLHEKEVVAHWFGAYCCYKESDTLN